jgi:hypothetical protein
MRINLIPLVDLYDNKNKPDSSDVSSITGMLGEELATALFCDFIERNKGIIEKVSNQCTLGSQSGKRLDRWIHVELNGKRYRFQTEIKNWSSHSKGGRKYPSNANELMGYRKNRWVKDFDNESKVFKTEACNKVLTPMKTNQNVGAGCVKPLIIFWDSMHPDGLDEEFFEVDVNCIGFHKLFVFSMSTYVHKLIGQKIEFVDTSLMTLKARMEKISNIVSIFA